MEVYTLDNILLMGVPELINLKAGDDDVFEDHARKTHA